MQLKMLSPNRISAVKPERPAKPAESRGELKQRLRWVEERERRRAELESQNCEHEQRIDAAVERHQMEAGEVQAQLSNCTDSDTRASLMGRLDRLNEDLEKTCSGARKAIAAARGELIATFYDTAQRGGIEDSLIKTASAAARARLWRARLRLERSESRLRESRRALANCGDDDFLATNWQSEVTAAARERSEAIAAVESVRQQLIQE